MRIAFVVNNYPPKVGGVESHVHSLARRLHALGHEILVVTLADVTGSGWEDGIEVVRLREHLRIGDVLGFPGAGATRQITRLLRERSVQAVSVHTRFFPMTWVGLRAGRRAGAVVVHTEHGSDHVVSSSTMISAASRLVDLTLGRWVLRRADVVLGVSERVTAFVKRLSGRDARVFYNAIEAAERPFDGGGFAARDRLVFVGRLVPGKGADVFVDVVASLAAEGASIEAVVLGDGPEREALAERIHEAGLAERIALRGRVSSDDVRIALRGSILVNPTTLAEGFQTTLLEALDVDGRIATYDVPGASLLRDQGYPVLISEASLAPLLEAVRAARAHAPAHRRLDGWYWDDRAAEYVSIVRDYVRMPRRGARR